MTSIIYVVGLIVIVVAILSFSARADMPRFLRRLNRIHHVRVRPS